MKLTARLLGSKSVAVVGMAKNTGKTVTVNCLISEATQRGMTVGLTSTGRDGETEDIITALPKPAIYLGEGSIIVTTADSMRKGSASLEILESTGIYNAAGELIFVRVREPGTVEVSGPERTADLKNIAEKMKTLTDFVILDGALDRIAASAPSVAEACVLATGAVIGRDVEKVVRATVHCTRLLQTPAVDLLPTKARTLIETGKSAVLDDAGAVKLLPFLTVVDAPLEILDYLQGRNNRLLIGGAFTDELAELVISAVRINSGLEVIVRDGTRIFVEELRWQRMQKAGIALRVLEPIKLVAITVNPIDPRGRILSGEELVNALQELLPELLVIDPLEEEGHDGFY